MKIPVDAPGAAAQRRCAADSAATQPKGAGTAAMPDTRPVSVAQRRHQQQAGHSPQTAQLMACSALMGAAPAAALEGAVQRRAIANHTGLPDTLKAGVESLSGMRMDHVRVHFNSDKPAQLNAHAYAQGNEIRVGPGQERHLAHEAWHVVQQMQGRVRPTMQMKGAQAVNDDRGLEAEADAMGARALAGAAVAAAGTATETSAAPAPADAVAQAAVAQLRPLSTTVLNVVGEIHPETEARLPVERAYCSRFSGSANYWTESQFRVRAYSVVTDFLSDDRARADPFKDRFEHVLLKADSTNPWHYAAAQAPQNFQDYARDRGADLAAAITPGTLRFARDMQIMLGNLVNTTDGQELTAQSRQAHLALRGAVDDLHAQAATSVARLNGGAALADKVAALDLMWARLETLKTAYGRLRTDPQVRVSRSDAMHLAAQARSNETGVWKIGERHREDMAGKDAAYNLVSEEAFSHDILEWRSETLLGPRDADTGQRTGLDDGIGNEDL